MQGIKPAFPATSQILCNWVAHLGNKRLKSKTLKSYVTGVRSIHMDMGYEDLTAFHSPQLERVITGLRRMRGEADSLERRPITKDLLLQMLLISIVGPEKALHYTLHFALHSLLFSA